MFFLHLGRIRTHVCCSATAFSDHILILKGSVQSLGGGGAFVAGVILIGGFCFITLVREKKPKRFPILFKITVNYLQVSSKIASIQVFFLFVFPPQASSRGAAALPTSRNPSEFHGPPF